MDRQAINPRERQVATLLAGGLTNRQIGEAMGISTGTVKGHVANLMIKWNCANRTQIAVRAVRAGLAPSPEHAAGDFQPPRPSVDESREVG